MGHFQKLQLKKWKHYWKINPGNQKILFPLHIGSVKFKWKLNVNCWWIYLNLCFVTELTTSEFICNSRLKKALCYMTLPNETILREEHSIQLHIRPKKKKTKIIKIGVNKTLNSENCFETGRLSNMSKPLTFHVIWKLTLDSS